MAIPKRDITEMEVRTALSKPFLMPFLTTDASASMTEICNKEFLERLVQHLVKELNNNEKST
jgi:hypothetical protein